MRTVGVGSSPVGPEQERWLAWAYYRAVLRGHEGREYERLEPVVWAELQRELAELDAREAACAEA
jgi:hypothetical protein